MSSNGDSTPAPTADDNLLAKGPHVKASIAAIKDKKEKILGMLGQISKDEKPDRELMIKLVAAFESMSAQETDYLGILTNVAEIHGKATEDMASELKDLIDKGKEAVRESKKESNVAEEADEDMKKEIESTLREISEMQTAALAASMVNEQLVAKLNLSKSKHLAMKQARDDATAAQSETARVVLEEREKARLEVLGEKQAMEKRKKELEKLRKSVVKKECEGGEEGAEVEMDESERIPPLRTKEEEEEEERKNKLAEEEQENALEKKRAEIRARVDAERKRRDGVNQQIREKLAAMDKRKERMTEIRRILSGISQQQEDAKKEGSEGNGEVKAEPKREMTVEEKEEKEVERTRKEIELNLAAASMSLKHLTEMRERLESLQSRGEEPTTEDEEMLRRLDEVEKMGGDETA